MRVDMFYACCYAIYTVFKCFSQCYYWLRQSAAKCVSVLLFEVLFRPLAELWPMAEFPFLDGYYLLCCAGNSMLRQCYWWLLRPLAEPVTELLRPLLESISELLWPFSEFVRRQMRCLVMWRRGVSCVVGAMAGCLGMSVPYLVLRASMAFSQLSSSERLQLFSFVQRHASPLRFNWQKRLFLQRCQSPEYADRELRKLLDECRFSLFLGNTHVALLCSLLRVEATLWDGPTAYVFGSAWTPSQRIELCLIRGMATHMTSMGLSTPAPAQCCSAEKCPQFMASATPAQIRQYCGQRGLTGVIDRSPTGEGGLSSRDKCAHFFITIAGCVDSDARDTDHCDTCKLKLANSMCTKLRCAKCCDCEDCDFFLMACKWQSDIACTLGTAGEAAPKGLEWLSPCTPTAWKSAGKQVINYRAFLAGITAQFTPAAEPPVRKRARDGKMEAEELFAFEADIILQRFKSSLTKDPLRIPRFPLVHSSTTRRFYFCADLIHFPDAGFISGVLAGLATALTQFRYMSTRHKRVSGRLSDAQGAGVCRFSGTFSTIYALTVFPAQQGKAAVLLCCPGCNKNAAEDFETLAESCKGKPLSDLSAGLGRAKAQKAIAPAGAPAGAHPVYVPETSCIHLDLYLRLCNTPEFVALTAPQNLYDSVQEEEDIIEVDSDSDEEAPAAGGAAGGAADAAGGGGAAPATLQPPPPTRIGSASIVITDAFAHILPQMYHRLMRPRFFLSIPTAGTFHCAQISHGKSAALFCTLHPVDPLSGKSRRCGCKAAYRKVLAASGEDEVLVGEEDSLYSAPVSQSWLPRTLHEAGFLSNNFNPHPPPSVSANGGSPYGVTEATVNGSAVFGRMYPQALCPPLLPPCCCSGGNHSVPAPIGGGAGAGAGAPPATPVRPACLATCSCGGTWGAALPLPHLSTLFTPAAVRQVQMYTRSCASGCGASLPYDGREDGLYCLSPKFVACEGWLCSILDHFYLSGSTYAAEASAYAVAIRRQSVFASQQEEAALEKLLPSRGTIALMVRGYTALVDISKLDVQCPVCKDKPDILVADGKLD